MQAIHFNYHNGAQTPCSSISSWYLDSGANHHVTPDLSALSITNEYNGTNDLLVGNGKSLPITRFENSSLSLTKSSLVYQMSCVFLLILNLYFMFINFVVIIVVLLDFTLLLVL